MEVKTVKKKPGAITLKPCPFCGNANRRTFTVDRAWHNSFVRCWICNATGPWQYDKNPSTAQAGWNLRQEASR